MEEAHIVVDVQASPLSELMQQKIDRGKTNEAKNFTIFRTPHKISHGKKNLFEPSVISIGPFHRGKTSLKAMEEQKWRFLESFLSSRVTSLDLCISEMKLLEEKTRRCYNETFDDLDSDTFVEMMLLDGCFVLEYFLKTMDENWNSIPEVGWNSEFINCDLLLLENQIPFFIVEKLFELIDFSEEYKIYFVKFIAHSMLSPEYILPAPPAETPDTIDSIIADPPAEIADSTHSTHSTVSDPAEIPDSTHSTHSTVSDPAEIPDSTDSTYSTDSTDSLTEIPDPPAEIHHLAHLCYHFIVPNPDKAVVLSSKPFDLTRMFCANKIIKGLLHQFRSRVLRGRSPHSTSRRLSVALPNSTGNLLSMVIPSATELKQKGVKFTPKSNPKHMLDISFEYGVLKIPRLAITDDTKPIFANLVAFEQTKYGKKNDPFTRFVAFLDNLVNTPNDVTILQQCGIIENWLGSEEELAHFLNQATEDTGLSRDHYLAELYMKVNRYIESSWPRHRAKLVRDYFSNPWAIISLVAAFVLLVLTCVQSFYAVYAYKVPSSS